MSPQSVRPTCHWSDVACAMCTKVCGVETWNVCACKGFLLNKFEVTSLWKRSVCWNCECTGHENWEGELKSWNLYAQLPNSNCSAFLWLPVQYPVLCKAHQLWNRLWRKDFHVQVMKMEKRDYICICARRNGLRGLAIPKTGVTAAVFVVSSGDGWPVAVSTWSSWNHQTT